MKFDKILVPTDFSVNGERALGFAVELARAVDASLTILHVYNATPYEIPEGTSALGILDIEGIVEEFRKQLERTKEWAEQAGAARVDTLLAQGNAHTEIVRLAEERGCGLIVMGTHGRTGFAHMLLGSVAEKVVRRAPCAVVTVPLREELRKAG